MYCGNCFRDNALVAELRRLGHPTLMVPLYLPMTLDEADQSSGTPIFFGGVNVYLEQKSALFRHAPQWLHKLLSSPKLLKWAAGRAAKTRAEDVADLTLSMLRGEEGNQARELDELIAWLKTQERPGLVSLSNALLAGMVRKIKSELGVPVVVMLQGEDAFLDSMPSPACEEVWRTLAERCREVDLFIAPSRYFGDLMARRLALPADKVKVVHNGINLDGFGIQNPESRIQNPPVLGYFARMCKEKGLDTLVEAFVILKQRGKVANLKLRVGGGCGPGDEPFVNQLKARLSSAGVLDDVEFHPNLTREQKLEFLRSLTVLSVPALYGEAFGLYVIEALAAGVPVVLPSVASFPELVEATGGGMLCEPGNAASLAGAIESLLLDSTRLQSLAQAGRRAVEQRFRVQHMAEEMLKAFAPVCGTRPPLR
ncbi:MAG: glycosyltransferase family 4 protein [Verrucomicrobia bacterium]|nr:glycosyltransferase family 4 protein [Verrucomicrobiota bacterium]